MVIDYGGLPKNAMVFTLSFTLTQSEDGKSWTFEDTSNINTNDQGYIITDFVRELVLTDYSGAVLDTIALGVENTATGELTEDIYINATVNLTGIASYTLSQGYPLMRITANKLQRALKRGCCISKSKINALNEATNFIIAAQFAAPTTDHAAFQTNISSANQFLDTIV